MIKNNLKKLREKQELTQKQVADELFVSSATVANWERSHNFSAIETVFELEKIFDCDFHDMFYEE